MNTKHQPGGKHVPGAIAILLAAGNYDPIDNGKRVKLIKLIPPGSSAVLRYKGVAQGELCNSAHLAKVWEVEGVDCHLHLTGLTPVCLDNNCYKQKFLLIIGDESLVKDEHTREQQHAADKTWQVIEEELAKI